MIFSSGCKETEDLDLRVWDLSTPVIKPSGLEMILLSSAPIRQRYWISLTAFGLGLSHLHVQICCSCAMTFLSGYIVSSAVLCSGVLCFFVFSYNPVHIEF